MLVLCECLKHSMKKLVIYISWMLVSGWVMLSLRDMQQEQTETQGVLSLWTSGNTFILSVTKLWYRLPREAGASITLEILESHLDTAPAHPAAGTAVDVHQPLPNSTFCAPVISYYQTCFLYSWGEVCILWILTLGFHGRNISFKIICFLQTIVLFSIYHH